mmetsp:Transcript_13291/g.43302  ORF Transcript_13291/g.43302 Transcript_13291/m.43302 type:complete len:234 (+) Transcript_13291:20-721(+)
MVPFFFWVSCFFGGAPRQASVRGLTAVPHRHEAVRAIKQTSKATEVTRLLERYQVDTYVLSAAMTQYRRLRRPKMAVALFKQHKARFAQNIITYNAAISAHAKLENWEQALELYEEVKKQRGLHPDLITYTALMNVLQKNGQWRQAMEVLGELEARGGGLEPDAYAYDAMIATCRRARRWQKAVDLFDELQARGLTPNVITCNMVLSACAKAGQVDTALRVFGDVVLSPQKKK